MLAEDKAASEAPLSPRRLVALRSLSLLFSVAAMLAKSSAMVLPLLVFGWHRWIRHTTLKRTLPTVVPQAAIATAAAIAVHGQWTSHSLVWPQRPLPMFADVTSSMGFYWWKTVWPSSLSPLYPTVPCGYVWMGSIWAIGLLLTLWSWKRLPSPARFAIVGFHAALLPVCNIVPLYFRFADRYSLLAHFALVAPLAVLCDWLWSKQREFLFRTGVLVALLLFGIRSWELSRTWTTSLNLWRHATLAQPNSQYAHLKLGETLRKAGRTKEAISTYLTAAHFKQRRTLALVGLFASTTEFAEKHKMVPAGSANKWQGELRNAESWSEVASLVDRINASGCTRCAQSLLRLSLQMFPPSNPELSSLAEVARRNGNEFAVEEFVREAAARINAADENLCLNRG